MRVLLLSTYELGHQPLHLASPAAALLAAGHEVRCVDLAAQAWDQEAVAWAGAAALSVPMHTAMRLAAQAARRIRESRPGLPLCLYGLYAGVSRELTLGPLADHVVAGEYEPGLLAWVEDLGRGRQPGPSVLNRDRGAFSVPRRELLPPLGGYAHLAMGGQERVVGYVEASHGCASRCRHCPVPAVYDGRVRIVGRDVVVEDVARLVAAGARHITFGDPDFLNAVHHSLRVVDEVHGRFPELTFDCTTKVELILRHHGIWGRMAEAGCLFVVTAVECVNDAILARIDKGHTAADAARAVTLLREHGIEPRPSLLPFTPWTTVADVAEILDFVVDHDLVGNVDPVHYSIRLLVPDGSLLLSDAELVSRLGGYDAEHLTWRWSSADPEVDRLQARLAALVEDAAARGEGTVATFARVTQAVAEAPGGRTVSVPQGLLAGSLEGRPRLTEPWFC